MITVLLIVTVSIALVQFSTYFGRLFRSVDYFGLLLLVSAVVYLLTSVDSWFMVVVLPAMAIVGVVVNRHHGIVSKVDVNFKNEIQWLSTVFATLFALAWLLQVSGTSYSTVVVALTAVLLAIALWCHLLLVVHIGRYKLSPAKRLALDELNQLPTVSVLVPARNESHALNDSITKLLQSTYPKLEVLILDDCSHDKTPEIIRSFAHDGARFIEGTPPPPEWLGRNWALQQLSRAANGELLIFADTDVKFSANSVAEIVGVMQRDQLDMVSFVPVSTPSGWLGQLLPSLTNFWLSLVPFRLLHGRAAIGRCFAIRKQVVPESQFEDYRTSIYPVYGLSKAIIATDNRYKFFYGKQIGLAIQHHYHSTARSLLRSLSPALANRFDLTVVLVLFALLVLMTPFVAIAIGATVPGLVLLAVVGLLFVRVELATGTIKSLAVTTLLWPLHVAHEIIFLITSVIRYRYTDLSWKERRVCMPLLQTHQKLPEM